MNWTGESVFRGPLLLGVGVLHILRLSSSSMAADAEDRLQLFPNAGKLSRGEEVQPPPRSGMGLFSQVCAPERVKNVLPPQGAGRLHSQIQALSHPRAGFREEFLCGCSAFAGRTGSGSERMSCAHRHCLSWRPPSSSAARPKNTLLGGGGGDMQRGAFHECLCPLFFSLKGSVCSE